MWSWGLAEQRLVGGANHSPNWAKRHLGWVDPALDEAWEAIADTKDAAAAVNDWKDEQDANEARLAGQAASATVHGVEDAAGWTGDRATDGAHLAGEAASNMVDGAQDTATWVGNRAKDAWHGVNPLD